MLGATVVGLTARASEDKTGEQKRSHRVPKKWCSAKGIVQSGPYHAVVAEEDGAITATELAKRVIAGTSSRCKIMGKGGQRKVAVVDDTTGQLRGP